MTFFKIIFLHQTQDYQRVLSTLTKFDLKLTLNDDWKSNFYPIIQSR